MIFQRTIEREVSAIGVGLHSGCRVKLTLKPAKDDAGIVFVRTDLPNAPPIKCDPFLIDGSRLSSMLINPNTKTIVGTIEHLMSGFACFGIDNIVVELSAPEIPIMDGSSNSFLYLLNQAKVIEQSQKKRYIKIKQQIDVIEGDKWVRFTPYDGYKIRLSLEYNHPLFMHENSVLEIDFAKQSYVDEISRARTFAFMYEIEAIRNNGLGLGGNLNNAIVIDDMDVLNESGLRYRNEFVRHKILDAVGDLHVIGHPLIGFFEGFKSGHAINNKLLRELLNKPETWEYVTFENEDQVPSSFHQVI